MTRDQLRLIDAMRITNSAADRLRDSLRHDAVDLRSAIALLPKGDAGALREVDAFVQRYQQIVEHVSHRLLGALYRIEELGERPPSLRNLLVRFEGARALPSAEAWRVYIEIRNRLVHEYPLDEQDRSQALVEAIVASQSILAELDALLGYINDRDLLEQADVE